MPMNNVFISISLASTLLIECASVAQYDKGAYLIFPKEKFLIKKRPKCTAGRRL
jgi:hypothetical protein